MGVSRDNKWESDRIVRFPRISPISLLDRWILQELAAIAKNDNATSRSVKRNWMPILFESAKNTPYAMQSRLKPSTLVIF